MNERKRRRRGRTIQWQKVRSRYNPIYKTGSGSPYWDWVARHWYSRAGNATEPLFADVSEKPEPDTREPDERTLMIEAIKSTRFSTKEKDILVMVQKGFSYREIADFLGVSLATVQTHITRARKKVRSTCHTKGLNGCIEGETFTP